MDANAKGARVIESDSASEPAVSARRRAHAWQPCAVLSLLAWASLALAQPNVDTETRRRMQQEVDRLVATRAAGPALFGPPAGDLVGKHHGVLACGGSSYRAELTVARSADGVLRASYQQRMLAGADRTPAAPEQAMRVFYEPWLGRISMVPERPAAPAGQPVAGPVLVGLVLADGSGWLMSGGSLQGCTPLTLRRGASPPAEWAYFDRLTPGAMPTRSSIFDLPGRLLRLPELLRGGCRDEMVRWVAQLPALQGEAGNNVAVQWNLFHDIWFVPFFGKPFLTLSDSEREALGERLQGECTKAPAYREAARTLLGGVVDAFRSLPGSPRIQVAATNIAQHETRLWAAQLRSRLELLAQTGAPPETVDEVLKAAQPLLELLWPPEYADFRQLLVDSKGRLLAGTLAARMRAGVGDNEQAMERLEQLAGELQKAVRAGSPLTAAQGQALQAQLAEVLNRELPTAAGRRAETADSPVAINMLIRWTGTFPHIGSLAAPDTRKAVQAIFDERFKTVVRQNIETDRAELKRLLAAGGSPVARLRALTAFGAQTETLRTEFLQGPEWSAWLAEVTQARQGPLNEARDELVRQVQQAANRGDVEKLMVTYLEPADHDTAAGRPIVAAAESRLAAVAPFRKLPGGAYLDALYGGDFDRARQIDAEVAAAARADIRNGTERLLGRPPAVRADPISEAHLRWITGSRASLAKAVGSTYIVNYAVRSKRCLGDNPASVTIETTIIEKGRNIGGPYEREVGRSTNTVLFKEELRGLSQSVSLSDPSFAVALSSLFTPRAGDAMGEVLRGTTGLMNSAEFDCAGTTIKTFEARLVEYLRMVPGR